MTSIESTGPPDRIWEFPGRPNALATELADGRRGYFRLLPYRWTRHGIRRLNAANQPAVFYLHPWEIDPDQPRLPAGGCLAFGTTPTLRKPSVACGDWSRNSGSARVSDVLAKRQMARRRADNTRFQRLSLCVHNRQTFVSHSRDFIVAVTYLSRSSSVNHAVEGFSDSMRPLQRGQTPCSSTASLGQLLRFAHGPRRVKKDRPVRA